MNRLGIVGCGKIPSILQVNDCIKQINFAEAVENS